VLPALVAIAVAAFAIVGISSEATTRTPLVILNGRIQQLSPGDNINAACANFSSTGSGCVSASGGGTTNFLRADGSWSAPSGGGTGTVTSVATGAGLTGGPITTSGTITCSTFTSGTEGCVSASGGGIGNFLRADGSWAAVFDVAGTNLSSSANTISCPNFTSGAGGCVPSSGGGTTNYLRADGSWDAPSGGGTVTGTGTVGSTPVWATSTSVGNGTTADNGTTFTVGNFAGTVQQDSTTTGTVNNYSLGATTTVLVFTGSSSVTLTGMTGGVSGRTVDLFCATSSGLCTLDIANLGSTSTNRFNMTTAQTTYTLNDVGGYTRLIYDSTLGGWRIGLNVYLPALVVSPGSLTATANSTALGTTSTGRLTVSGLSNANESLIVGYAFTAGTGSTDAEALTNTGTYNTTSAAITSYGLNASNAATISSGTNTLTDVAIYGNANGTGGSVDNVAIWTDNGDVDLNVISGNTTVLGTTFTADNNVVLNFLGGSTTIDGNATFSGPSAHVSTVGATAPTLTSCGSSSSIHGSDIAGRFTTGTGATTCTLTFGATYTNPPACIVEAEGVSTEPTFANSATAITMSVDIASTTYDYMCWKVQ
jgi:hypothetical protein